MLDFSAADDPALTFNIQKPGSEHSRAILRVENHFMMKSSQHYQHGLFSNEASNPGSRCDTPSQPHQLNNTNSFFHPDSDFSISSLQAATHQHRDSFGSNEMLQQGIPLCEPMSMPFTVPTSDTDLDSLLHSHFPSHQLQISQLDTQWPTSSSILTDISTTTSIFQGALFCLFLSPFIHSCLSTEDKRDHMFAADAPAAVAPAAPPPPPPEETRK
jgi:hypothetical protein